MSYSRTLLWSNSRKYPPHGAQSGNFGPLPLKRAPRYRLYWELSCSALYLTAAIGASAARTEAAEVVVVAPPRFVEAIVPHAGASVKRFFYYLRRRCAWSEEVEQKQRELEALFLSTGAALHKKLRASGPKALRSAAAATVPSAPATVPFFSAANRSQRRGKYKRHW